MKIDVGEGTIGLYGTGGIYAGTLLPLDKGRLIIGRDPRICNVLVQNRKVSRLHCTVWYDSNKDMYAIEDFSANGVFTESGERLKERTTIFLKRQSVIYIVVPENRFRLL